jgi:cellulose synthase (UDP-forming)
MDTEILSAPELITPALVVIATLYVAGPLLPMKRPWARWCVFVAAAFAVARYLLWRILDTVTLPDGQWHEVGWIWFCLAVELLAFLDLSILFMTFLRASDRRAEADVHESRMRAMPRDEVPSVDVFIPTYNEPLSVLEKTITGALCMDYPCLKIWVLDDGRRSWLMDFCLSKGVGYLTRPDNAHAKAGNINHALTKTTAEFVAVFDADFIPQQNFLMRTLGFFRDPKVGIVQTPHAFYNYDPMQANLALRDALPHDQSFFFEAIMPSKDAWDAAFCCGSNSVMRREALRPLDGAIPTESITEDILLTLAILRQGYVTRYLCERLAYGLAPESLDAFFVQRQRWARGGIQTLFLASGPLGRGLTLPQRLMFLPMHWLSQSPLLLLSLVVPIVFLWTSLLPFVNVTAEAEIYYFIPMILAVVGAISLYAPKQFSPLAAYVLGAFQSFKMLPHVLQTIVRPFGHVFKVTPKGHQAERRLCQREIFWPAAVLMLLTAAGLIVNASPEYRIVSSTGLFPIAALMATVNIVVLFLVCMLSLQKPINRAEERFEISEEVSVFSAGGVLLIGRTKDISMSGAGIVVENAGAMPAVGDRIRLYVAEVGFVAGDVVRTDDGFFGVRFDLPPSVERDLMIRKLFTSGFDTAPGHSSAWASTAAVLRTIWANQTVEIGAAIPVEVEAKPTPKLPARSFLLAPRKGPLHLAELGVQRRRRAA